MILRSEKKIIGGHRGSPRKYRENTLKSFETAIADGADFIEFDVRKSKDGYLIIHHDASIDGNILKNMKLSEIKALSESIGYEVPVLEDVLRLCVNRIMLDIEIKEPEATAEAIKHLFKYYSHDGFIISSFFDEVLSFINSRHPGIKKGLIFDAETSVNIEDRITILKPDFLLPHFSIYNNSTQSLCRKFNLRAIIWTVNNKIDMKKYLDDPLVAGIISDKPEMGTNLI